MNNWIDRFRPSRDSKGSRSLLYQLLLVGGGLLLLWGLIALVPSSPPPSPVASDEAGTVAASAPSSNGFTVFTPGRIAVLVLLAGGAVAAVYLNKRSNASSSSTAAALQSLGQLSLSPNQHIRLVRCSEEILVLGVSPNEVRLLKSYPEAEFELPDGTSMDPDARATSSEPASLSSFAHVLRQYANGSNHE